MWKRMLHIIRSGTAAGPEEPVACHALRILDQEIRDAERRLGVNRAAHARLVLKSALAAARVSRSQARLAALTERADSTLAGAGEEVALKIAGQIAGIELMQEQDAHVARKCSANVHTLRGALQISEDRLAELKLKAEAMRFAAQLYQARAV
jgi:phage shock protein A